MPYKVKMFLKPVCSHTGFKNIFIIRNSIQMWCNFKNERKGFFETMPEYWKNATVSYTTILSVSSKHKEKLLFGIQFMHVKLQENGWLL